MELKDILNRDETFRYMLLDRMRADCEYYLGNGNRLAKHLWAGNEVDQIACMKALWNSFGEEGKPEWLSYDKILDYEKQIGIKAILVEMDHKGYYERFALTPEEFEKEFPDTYKAFGPIDESNTDTIKPLVHIWFEPCVVGDASWERHFTDMEWGLPESDIESGNTAYIDYSQMQSLRKYVPEDPVVTLIAIFTPEEVRKYDWSMPVYNPSEYDNFSEYESECLDVGHERRGEICGLVIDRLRKASAINADDDSYFEMIDEEVWNEITNHITRNMSKDMSGLDVPTVIDSLTPGQMFLELDTEKTIELTKKVDSDIWQFRVYDNNHNYLYDTTATETRLAKDIIAGYIVTKAEMVKKLGLEERINDAAERAEKSANTMNNKDRDDNFEIS